MSWAARNMVGDLPDRLELAGLRVLQALVQRLMTDCETERLPAVASVEHPLAGLGDDVQLAIGRDVVEPGVGARVGDHHEALLDEDSGAIGHRLFPRQPDRTKRMMQQLAARMVLPHRSVLRLKLDLGRLSSTRSLTSRRSEPPPWRVPRTGAAPR